MTGIYNERNYIEFGLLDPKATTFGHVLKKAGYKTCIVGKWQLKGGINGPNHFGFDEHCLWQLTRRPSRYPNPGLEINGKEIDFTNGEYGPNIVSDYLCDFIERNQDGPFFAYYPMILPHWPFEPTPDSADWNPNAKGVLKGVGDMKYFADMVTYTDKLVGKIVETLDRLKLRENTVVLFTCDNGTYTKITSKMGDREVLGGKGSPKDNGTHVPFIASWPNHITSGGMSEELVDFSDFLPTLAEFAKTSVPNKIDGQSLTQHLLGKKVSHRKWSYCWYHRNGVREKASRHIRDQHYKLYADDRFYELDTDPMEMTPLTTERQSTKAKMVRQEFRKILTQVESAGSE